MGQNIDKTSAERIRVLIVEDDAIPAHYLQGIIEENNAFRVERIVTDAATALTAVAEIRPEIIFMDIMIEGPLSGAELALKIHIRHPEILILFLTAYSNEEMMEYAAQAEAFAYLLKPYRPREIHAALKLAAARLRRSIASKSADTVELVDGFGYHPAESLLTLNGVPVSLSARETGLIRLLCAHPGRIVDKEVMLDRLELTDTSLRSLIYRIRKATSDRLIESIKRYGYRVVLRGEE